jgi:short-subunit dehydrogenase
MPLPAPAPDRTALVTGASSGIGLEIAKELARRGHGVTLVARREERLKELAAQLTGVRVEVVAADLGREEGCREVVAEVERRGLMIDVLVNNAGLSTQGPVRDSEAARELAMVRLDVEAVVHLCSLVVPGMAARGRGAVLNVASTAAMQPLPGQAAYGASKAFVLSYTRALAAELRGTGVTATALCPGPVETEFAATAGWTPEQVEKALPKAMWVAADAVAKAGVDGAEAGRQVVIPGLGNRTMAALSHLVPHRLLVPVLARQHPSLRR